MKLAIKPVDRTDEAPPETGAFPPLMPVRQSHAQMTFKILHEFPTATLEYRWRELLKDVKTPSHYTSPEYFREPYFEGKRPFAILALVGDAVVAVLTGVHEGNAVTCGLSTRPQIQLHPEFDAVAVLGTLARGLESESIGAELVSVYSWNWLSLDPMLRHHYRSRALMGNPVLDLRVGADALLKRCDGKRRNCIRYAIKHGVEVSAAESPEEYDAFYKIYASWCEAKKIPCYPSAVEDLAFRTTRLNRRLFVARHSGKIIAGSVFRFYPGGLIEYSRNSSLPEFQSLKPNDLLVWKAIEWACEKGFTRLSMGGSHRFLREFGGTMVPIIRYRWDRTLLRRHDRREDLVEAGRRCMSKLPPVWERKVRELIGKQLPAGW
ncbi:MAG TPA: GNAT family N-acetyltransferase [Silvibacterium sp.]|nr:GNAT family N-acetyltransferase [Silvibacterium sp.]